KTCDITIVKKKRDEKVRKEVEEKLFNDIIPSVVNESKGMIERELQQYTASIHETIQEDVVKQRDLLQQSLQEVRQQKEEEQLQREERKKQLNEDIQKVRGYIHDTITA